jgi:hypothetical protein
VDLAQDTQQQIMRVVAAVEEVSSAAAADIAMVLNPMEAEAAAPVSHLEIA